MRLSNFYTNMSTKNAASTFRGHTLETALKMYKNGWTIIGSYFKASSLHPWKNPTKEQLKDWAISDFNAGRANSINLRLSDSQVIALDCDFPNEGLTRDFIKALPGLLSIMPNRLFTCCGAKGCKVFFRYSSELYQNQRLPSKLGLTAYEPQTGLKHELEIKTTLSTVLGMHSAIGDENGRLIDYLVYSHYPKTKPIAKAKPSDLPKVGFNDVQAIEALYNNLILSAGFTDDKGCPLDATAYNRLLFSSLCVFAQCHIWSELQERIQASKLDVSIYDLARVEPAYLALGLKDAIDCLTHIFLHTELIKPALEPICERFKAEILSPDCSLTWLDIERLASYANRAFDAFESGYLKRRAWEIGAPKTDDDLWGLTWELMRCYENL